MKKLAVCFTSLFVAVSSLYALPSAWAADPSSAEEADARMKKWREARTKIEAKLSAHRKDPDKAKTLGRINKTLDDMEGALSQVLSGEGKAVVKAREVLGKKRVELNTLMGSINADGQDGDIMTILGEVLSRQHQTQQNAIRNMR